MTYFAPSFFYFAFFGALSFLMPFLALFYQSLGFNGAQIGFLTGISPLVTLFAAPFWTGLADSSRRHKAVMALTIIVSILSVLLISRFEVFFVLLPLVILYAFFGAPAASLADSATMFMLGSQKDRYGRIRLWGTVGWGVVAPVAGMVVERFGLSWSFYGYALIMLGCLFSALALRFPQERNVVPFQTGMRSLLRNRSWIFFLLMVLFAGVGLATVNSYLFVYMQNLGLSKSLMGLTLAVSTLSELPVMFFANRFLKRFNPRVLLVLALLTIAGRLMLYSISQSGWQILLIQLLHGFTFPIIWVAGVAYADRIAPSGMTASAQGMFGTTLMGLGAALGAFLGGLLLQRFSPSEMYFVVSLGLFVAAGLFFVIQQFSGRKNKTN